MTKIGIIGGAGPYASALFYQVLLDHLYAAKVHPIPEILIWNFPFTRGLTSKESQKHKKILQDELQYCLNAFASLNISRAAIVCNTLHYFLKNINLKGIEFFHLPKLVQEAVIEQGTSKLLLLSTQTTQLQKLYSHPQLNFIKPNEIEQSLIDATIDHVLAGKTLIKDSLLLKNLIEKLYQKKSFAGIVLGCTELPILHKKFPLHTSLPVFDSIEILARKICEYCILEERTL